MRILFIGSVKFSLDILMGCINEKKKIVGIVITNNNSKNADYVDLSEIANLHSIPIFYTTQINSEESIEWCKNKNPDIIFCFGWSQIIKKGILSIPAKGVIGYHPTLLPKNRGRHPIIWALVLGLPVTGSTFFIMNEGVDSGEIISQKKIKIDKTDNAMSLYSKITLTALKQIKQILRQLDNNTLKRRVQNNNKATYWPKRTEKDGKIDWRMNSELIYNLVRALSYPYPGAYIEILGLKYRIMKCKIMKIKDANNIIPGYVLDNNIDENSFVVKCGMGVIKISEHTLLSLPEKGTVI